MQEIALSAAAGVVVTIAMSWAIVLATQSSLADAATTQGVGPAGANDELLWRITRTSLAHRIRVRSSIDEQWFIGRLPSTHADTLLCYWMPTIDWKSAQPGYVEIHDAAGWPLLAFRSVVRSQVDISNRSVIWSAHVGVCVIPAAPARKQIGDPDFIVLPVIPVWPGVVCNAASFAAFAWMGLFGTRRLKRAARLRRGRCAKCGYPIGESPKCTECGAPTQATPSTAPSHRAMYLCPARLGPQA